MSAAPPHDLSRALRLLFLAPFAPRLGARHGGGRAIAELLVQLARRHRVALLYLRGQGEPDVDAATRAACDLVREVPRPAERGPVHWTRLAIGALRREPMWAVGWKTAPAAAALREIITGWRPDVVQCEYHVMGQYLSEIGDGEAARVLRQHEPGAAAAGERAKAHGGPARWLGAVDRRAWTIYEAAIMRRADAVVALTERDAAALRALAPQARVECIPLGIDVPNPPLSPLGTGTPGLLFVGNFIHAPNVDAATRLARDIIPRVRAARPQSWLRIVGADPAGRIAALARDGVIVTGEVDDVTPFLDEAAVVIVPLRLGGGMRVKVMEALAAGKAVVASRLAVEGLDVAHGDQVMLAETDEEFVTAAVELLSDPERRAARAHRARAWAAANLGWDRPIAAFEALYASLIPVRV